MKHLEAYAYDQRGKISLTVSLHSEVHWYNFKEFSSPPVQY